MTNPAPAPSWAPLSALAQRLAANVTALSGRYPDLAARLRTFSPSTHYFIATLGDGLVFGTSANARGPDVRPLPAPLPAARAAATVAQLCPDGTYTQPVLVAGEDQGWLWDRLYRLPCGAQGGYRPPLLLVMPDLERLWLLLHVQDWRDLLADPRVRLFAGPDAVAQLGRSFADDWSVAWPTHWVTVDAAVWPAGVTVDTLQRDALGTRLRALSELMAPATPAEAAAVAARLTGGGPLRVLGITSRHTTFLQHSMRDWLAGFERLGHRTRLSIESADHETGCPLIEAAACRDFRPDLVVIIDHYRAEIPGLPAHVPVVMWVQDRLPNIFRPDAGAAQGPLDFCLGLGRLGLVADCGYPPQRFMSCPVGTNVERYAARPPTDAESARHGCDVSYVSNASETAEQIIDDYCRGVPPVVAGLLGDVLARMKGHYARDPRILGDVGLARLLREATTSAGLQPNPHAERQLLELLTQRVNNALVRHQALTWVADLGVDLRLYGRGWERHPTLARFARGVADNQTDLAAIYRSSAVNLQVTPFGCVHQRLLDGLAAGGFFLARWHQVDEMGTAYQGIWDWCVRHDVTGTADLRARATPGVAALLRRIDDLHGFSTADAGVPLYEAIRAAADGGFAISADGIWGADYAAVAFATGAELKAKLAAALADPAGRRAVADRMREQVVARFSYRQITAGLLTMIAKQLPAARPSAENPTAAAAGPLMEAA